MDDVVRSIDLKKLIPTYRRDTDDVVGAVRMSAVEMVSMEQMPGGRFQISVRTNSGGDYFVSPVYANLRDGFAMLEAYWVRLGGEEPELPDIQPVSRHNHDTAAAPATLVPIDYTPEWARQLACDPGVENPLVFYRRRTQRRSRPRLSAGARREVRVARRRIARRMSRRRAQVAAW